MMKRIVTSLILLSICVIVKAQSNCDANLIPKELLPYASAVVRNEEINVEVRSLDNTLYHVKRVVTVLNKNGDDLAHIVIEHDKNNIIRYVKGLIYDEFGRQTGKFSESDFDDVSAGHDFSLFEDVRIKHYLPAVTQYPYTIAYEYERRSKQTLNFEDWEPVPETGIAVEKSTYTFTCKPDFIIRYKENNLPGKAITITNAQGVKTYTWQAAGLKAIKDEPFSPYKTTYLSSLNIAPENFEYYGFPGSFKTWKDLGKWEYDQLIANRQDLSPETIQQIREITSKITDPKLKAKRVYEYVQQKTHYISVQVGIGGNQPFLASDVDKQNYGDCKALVNYTQALLKAINIDSYYCVVESGASKKVSLLSDFASMEQGNHIILCVPFKNDTTWADCTSQTIPFGYLGSFTDDRTVLACTPEGGKLMHTPKYTYQNNLESRTATFTISSDGVLSGNMATTFKGADYEDRELMINEPKTEQRKMLQRIYPMNNMNIEKLELKQDKSFDPLTTESVTLNARDYANLGDNKIYFLLNAVDRKTYVPKQLRNRMNSVYINRGYTTEDEITYTVPDGYKIEKRPLNISVDKPFGKFTATMEMKGNQLVYKRKFQLIDGTYSKDFYQDVVDFYQEVVDADDYSVVLVKS